MSRAPAISRTRLFTAVALAVALSGCASVSLEQNLNRVNAEAVDFTGGQLSLIINRNFSVSFLELTNVSKGFGGAPVTR